MAKKRKQITEADIQRLADELSDDGTVTEYKVKKSAPVVVEKSKYTNEEFKQLLAEARDKYEKRQKERQKNLEERINQLTKKALPETKALTKLQEEINKSLEPVKKLTEPMEKLQQNLAKSTAIPLNPFTNFMSSKVPVNVNTQGGLLGLAKARGMFTRKGLMAKYKPNSTLLGSARIVRKPVVRHKPDKEKRKASVIGMGVNSYMTKHSLVNPVEMAKAHTKNRDYKVTGFIGLRQICEEMNVNVEEAFLYICEGMQSNDTRWRKHRIEKEFWRGSESVANIVRYYKDKNKEKQLKGQAKYSVKALHKSDYVKNIFKQNQAKVPSYSVFSQWFKDMKHHCEVLKLA